MIPLYDNNPTRRPPVVTVLLIAACVLAFIWQWTLADREQVMAVYRFGTIPAALLEGRTLPAELAPIPAAATLLTSLFMHGGWLHLFGNMLYLWIFGNNIEDALGHGRFLVFYLICGVLASLAHALPDPTSEIPLVGASGAIAGVLAAYLLLFPRARILVLVPLLVMFFTLRLPALLVIGLWFAVQVLSHGDGSSIAFGAHIGGFIAGLVLLPILKPRQLRLFRGPG